MVATLVGLARLLSNGPVRYFETPSSSFCFPRLMILLALCICFYGLRVYSSYWILWAPKILLWRVIRTYKRFQVQELFDATDSKGIDPLSRSHEILTLANNPEVSVIDKTATEQNDMNKRTIEEEKALDPQDAPCGTSTLLSAGSSSPEEGLWDSSIPEADTTMTTPDTGRYGSSTDPEGMPRLYAQLPSGGGDLIPFKGIHNIYIYVRRDQYPRRCLFDSGSDVNVMSQDSQVELGFTLEPLDPSDSDNLLLPGKKIKILGKVKCVSWRHEGGAKTYKTEWFVVDTDQFDAVYGNPDMEKEQMLYMHRR